MNADELQALWESYLRLTPGALGNGKAPAHTPPAENSGLSGRNADLYPPESPPKPIAPALPPTAFALIGTAPRRILR